MKRNFIFSLAATFITAAVTLGSFTACSNEEELTVTEQPAQLMISEFKSINEDATDKFNDGMEHSRLTILVIIAVLLVLGTIGALFVANRIVKPAPLFDHGNALFNYAPGDSLKSEKSDLL